MEFQRKTGEAESIKNDVQTAEATLCAAKQLLEKLSEEKERWEHQTESLKRSKALIMQTSILTSAYITYLSSKAINHRKQQIKVCALRVLISLVLI